MSAISDGRKELEAILWAGADVLRSKMDANEYKDYLLSFVFYKYLSDSFLAKAYDLLNDCELESIEKAQRAYEKVYEGEDAKDLLDELKESCRYVIEPRLTFFALAEQAKDDPALKAFTGTQSAPLTKFKARSQMIAELEEMIVEEVLPLQIGVNY